MNELRLAALCLQAEGKELPTQEYLEKDMSEHRRNAEKDFQQLLSTLPQEMLFPVENTVLALVSSWIDESYERGFAAGMRLMHQALSAH